MGSQMHRIHIPNVGEGMIYKPAGSPYRYDDEEKYPLGSYMRLGNKGFVYGHSAGITDMAYGAKPCQINQPVGWSAVKESVDAGVRQITVELDSVAGPAGNGNIAKDYLKWGECYIAQSYGVSWVVTILGNSLVEGGAGGEFTIDLASPTPLALVADTAHAECIPSLYRELTATAAQNDPRTPVVGMATCVAPDGKYLWFQVSGAWVLVAQTDFGDANDRAQAVFLGNGSIGRHDAGEVTEKWAQHAGYVMFPSYTGGQGAPFIMLEIGH